MPASFFTNFKDGHFPHLVHPPVEHDLDRADAPSRDAACCAPDGSG
jgi:hypothetical protein